MYNRYIPPKKQHAMPPISSPPTPPAPPPPTTTPPPPKRLKTKPPAGEDTIDNRHKTLISKRDKSLRRAETFSTASKSTIDATIEAPEQPTELHDLIPLPQPEPVPEPQITHNASSSLPRWLAAPIRISPNTTAQFADMGIQPSAIKSLSAKGFKKAFAVQAAVLPLLLPGPAQRPGDIIVSAATGSGKTLAYVLPMIEDLSRNVATKLRGIIVMPTRELVTQARDIAEICASAFSTSTDRNEFRKRVKIDTAIGSDSLAKDQSTMMEQHLDYNPVKAQTQEASINEPWIDSGDSVDYDKLFTSQILPALPDHVLEPRSKIDLLICTPGRLVEHLKSTPGFSLEHLKWLVVDEADKLLDQSFQQWLDIVIGQLPQPSNFGRREYIRKIILSATMTRDVGQLNSFKLHRPKLVVLDGKLDSTVSENANEGPEGYVLPSLLAESAIKVEDSDIKPLYLLEILKREKMLDSDRPSRSPTSDETLPLDNLSLSESTEATRGVLIFTKSTENALRLGRLLPLLEPSLANSVATITSTKSTGRQEMLKGFKSGKLSILVASDLVGRGLDLPNLAHVINYDIPTSIKDYVHRVGRTARAGRPGHAWTLFTETEGRWFWHEIGRSSLIQRLNADSKISRLNIKKSHFGEKQREQFQEALDTLGAEAKSSK
ncbi:ATP-dependent RNA helicase dbp6 [Lachnellula suecica]|uniref:ATP-dependent RNA helicase n=1 Tax=Lachnellula suecica TaxID=602035 RepID=A0A8T9CDE9_9HELO|nr:ATP-dependent RNA helicase dbp6 [Lachnellula suecica]